MAVLPDDTSGHVSAGHVGGATEGLAVADKVLFPDPALLSLSGLRQKITLAAATGPVTALQSGEKFQGAVDAVFTLPAVAGTKGCWWVFETGALSGGVGLRVVPQAGEIIAGQGLTETVSQGVQNTGATDRLYDSVTIMSDGVKNVITAIVGTWAKA